MSDWIQIRERYMRDDLATRLGGLAANLLRIGTLSRRPGYAEIVSRLIRESGFFIEWTAEDMPSEPLAELVELQLILARWHRAWPEVWSDDSRRARLAADAASWSDRVLQLSGLASPEA